MNAPAAIVAPSGPEDLWRDYYPYVRNLVRTQGVSPQDCDDVASEILTRLIERDIIGMYDPQHSVEHRGRQWTASFRTFLSHQVTLYVRGKRDALGRVSKREPLLCDEPLDDGLTTWIERFGGGASWDSYPALSEGEFVARAREHLAALPPRSARDRCNLLSLFDALVGQVKADGRISHRELQERFKISSTSSYVWVQRLRDALTAAPAASAPPPLFHVGGVALSAQDVAAAAALLREARGIMVRQPLAKAGHPLAQAADPSWYHPFAAAERTLYPGLEIDPQTHRKPAGHVKIAVIHRLERMLAEAGGQYHPVPAEPEQPEPDSPAELFEAELWRLGATAAAVDRITGLARVAFCPPR